MTTKTGIRESFNLKLFYLITIAIIIILTPAQAEEISSNTKQNIYEKALNSNTHNNDNFKAIKALGTEKLDRDIRFGFNNLVNIQTCYENSNIVLKSNGIIEVINFNIEPI